MATTNGPTLDELADQFEVQWKRGDRHAFYEFADSVLRLTENETVAALDAASYIAGAMFVPGVDNDPLREEITMVAGQLEVPAQADAADQWRYLRKLVDELKEQGPERHHV